MRKLLELWRKIKYARIKKEVKVIIKDKNGKIHFHNELVIINHSFGDTFLLIEMK